MSGPPLYDLDPREIPWLVAPDMAWLAMVTNGFTLTPLRAGRSPKCYLTPGGTPVHVQPDCRCPR